MSQTYAIVELGGTQLRVEPGRFYDVNRIHSEVGDTLTLDKVLLVRNGDEISIGQPFVEGATVEGIVSAHRRGRKIIVYKMKPKKKTRKKRGHRQELTRVTIGSIALNGTVLAAEDISTSEATPVTVEVVGDATPESATAPATAEVASDDSTPEEE